jgi:hypothetical protein
MSQTQAVERDEGGPRWPHIAPSVYGELEKQGWILAKTWDLPDHNEAKLWKNPRQALTTETRKD